MSVSDHSNMLNIVSVDSKFQALSNGPTFISNRQDVDEQRYIFSLR